MPYVHTAVRELERMLAIETAKDTVLIQKHIFAGVGFGLTHEIHMPKRFRHM
jgi:hypothetical protein